VLTYRVDTQISALTSYDVNIISVLLLHERAVAMNKFQICLSFNAIFEISVSYHEK
jgi:hypothetical protein